MPKYISFKRGLLSVLFWSIISAAFIGPGTITTAAKAGSTYKVALAWVLVFSVIATIILQEAAARITIASGKNLGEFIAAKYRSGRKTLWILFLSVAFGCAAYEAGNILGSVMGLWIIVEFPIYLFILLIGLICVGFLWHGNIKLIANLLGAVVAVMGIVFIIAAIKTDIPSVGQLDTKYLPNIPINSSLLILGLIGTTIVPYNLFMASGLSKDQKIWEMRIGISLAVFIGGVISIAILIVGTQLTGGFSFDALGDELVKKSGPAMKTLFGIGLFSAGLSSAITAPLAAAITGQSLLGNNTENWGPKSKNFRMIWGSVLGFGLAVGLTNVPIVPAIILAQAINAFLLPVVAIFLLFAVNDRKLLSREFTNSWYSNILMILIVGVAIYLGLTNFYSALQKTIPDLWISSIRPIKLAITLIILTLCGCRVFIKK